MCSYRQLLLWRQTQTLAEQLYQVTRISPVDERWELAASLRQTALAIPIDIAQYYCDNLARFSRGLRQARRRLVRLEHQIHIARRLQFWSPEHARHITRQLARIRAHIKAFHIR